MRRRIRYVLGGPLNEELESKKMRGDQPLAEFNVFARRNGVDLVGTEQVRPGAPTSLLRRAALAWAVSRRNAEYDALVTSGEDIGFPLALVSLAQRARKPIWITLHGSYLESAKFRMIAPVLRQSLHVHLLCLSESLRDSMISVHGFSAARCFNVGYGVDTAFFRPEDTTGTPLIVAAGSANRDYQTLISAVEGLDVPLRIAADSLWRPGAAMLDGTLLPAGVTLGSAGDYVSLRALYRHASFVVVPLHPARHASGYAVIAEAMAMGKAVITTRTEAAPDLVIEGVTGFYTQPGDVAGLRDRIGLLLGDPARARAMGEAGAHRMQSKFSLDVYCDAIERLIEARHGQAAERSAERLGDGSLAG